ncbi:MAG TPA: hemerythrin domain-containing protein [Acidimicrobiia bacterium]|nr:hemerythrin domain-containing protein [Acidimicrobiia bacterium]
MTNIYEAIKESHEIQRSLGKDMTSKDATPQERKQAFLELAIELDAHASAEERNFYIPLQQHDEGLTQSRHAISEHHEAEEMVEDLRSLDPSGEAFMKHAKELVEKVQHHLKDEEHGFFQLSGRLLSDDQKVDLAKTYFQDYREMKTKLST